MTLPTLTRDQFFEQLSAWQKPYHQSYLAMYSSQWEGIVTDPSLWVIPVDDHAVHRGDAAFEVFKCINGRAYCFEDHAEKLKKTVKTLGIKRPKAMDDLQEIAEAVLKAGGMKEALIRMTVTRGPGGFTSNPYESPVGLLIVTAIKLTIYDDKKYAHGVKAITADLPAKDPTLATMKTCSYLQNVLIKKAAIDAGADYAISFNREGLLTESSTENVFIVTPENELWAPEWSLILKGTTLTRVMAIAGKMVKEGFLKQSGHRDITLKKARNAAEAMICSTTTDCLSITSWDGQAVGDGRQGPVAKEILKRLRREYQSDTPFTTPLWVY